VVMHTTELVRMNDITRVLLVYSCQQGLYPRGNVLPFRLPDVRFFTWNVRRLYRSGSLKTVARDLGKYKLDLVGVQKDR
jgi:hypothetical protein